VANLELKTVIETITHATDFSEASAGAFAHALSMALATRSRLFLLHVRAPGSSEDWTSFPHVRALLARWGLIEADELPSRIEAKFGVKIIKVDIQHRDAVSGLYEFILRHRPDLMVLATHGRQGWNRWLHGSIAEETSQRTHIPTLFLGPNVEGFVDLATGTLRLERVLVPIAHKPTPRRFLIVLSRLLASLGVSAESFRAIHVGDDPPQLEDDRGGTLPVKVLSGPVVEMLLREADNQEADMIAMPTAGHKGFLDALRGSTTEQLLRQARCPVLAVHALV
jgi:nucleotide-binding universal stress UspA family protein